MYGYSNNMSILISVMYVRILHNCVGIWIRTYTIDRDDREKKSSVGLH